MSEQRLTPREAGRRRGAARIAADSIETDPAFTALAAKTVRAARARARRPTPEQLADEAYDRYVAEHGPSRRRRRSPNSPPNPLHRRRPRCCEAGDTRQMTRLEVVCHECGTSTPVRVEERLVSTIPESARLVRVRDAVAYELVDAGEIPAVKVWSGGQRVVPCIALEAFLRRLLPEGASK